MYFKIVAAKEELHVAVGHSEAHKLWMPNELKLYYVAARVKPLFFTELLS